MRLHFYIILCSFDTHTILIFCSESTKLTVETMYKISYKISWLYKHDFTKLCIVLKMMNLNWPLTNFLKYHTIIQLFMLFFWSSFQGVWSDWGQLNPASALARTGFFIHELLVFVEVASSWTEKRRKLIGQTSLKALLIHLPCVWQGHLFLKAVYELHPRWICKLN